MSGEETKANLEEFINIKSRGAALHFLHTSIVPKVVLDLYQNRFQLFLN